MTAAERADLERRADRVLARVCRTLMVADEDASPTTHIIVAMEDDDEGYVITRERARAVGLGEVLDEIGAVPGGGKFVVIIVIDDVAQVATMTLRPQPFVPGGTA